MLYLEDYIEMIEHLPRELRDGFTEMREIDLQVHNSTDSLDERVRTFFGNARKMRVQERDTEFEAIRSAYHKTLEECDEKVEIAEQMYNLVDRYLRRLDQELHKFKLELEADNAGITQLLERRSLEMDPASARAAAGGTRNHHLAPAGAVNGAADWQKENRCYDNHSAVPRRHNDRKSMLTGRRDERDRERGVTSLAGGGATRHLSTNHNGHHHHHHHQSLSATPFSMTSSAAAAAASSSFGPLAPSSGGSGNSALMAAASQAIAATQHIQQGRRTTSSSGATTSSGSGSSSGFKTGYGGHDWLSSSSAAAAAAAGDSVFGSGSGGGGGGSDSGSVCHQQQMSSSSSSLAAAGEYPVVARELAGAAHAALLSSGLAVAGSDKRKRKSTSARPVSVSPCPSDDFHPPHSSHHYHHQHHQQQQQLLDDMMLDEGGADGSLAATGGSTVAPGSGAGAEDDQWLYDSSEPRYCICQNVSYGDMVACDNRECPYEWFHYPCVGITAPPKGKWYCPQCSVTMKRRRQK